MLDSLSNLSHKERDCLYKQEYEKSRYWLLASVQGSPTLKQLLFTKASEIEYFF